ncbi:hypothetical protein FQR65_LT19457 [Abscondita terminalis]|nr:hypothetical protein FQR65_LT19457 [Abscondita terminalis]
MDTMRHVSKFTKFLLRTIVNVLCYVFNLFYVKKTTAAIKIRGGGRKKATFSWCEITEGLLLESHTAVLEHNEKPVKKYLLSRFIQNLNDNQIRFVKASVTESSLIQKLNNLLVRDNKEAQRKYIEWNAETENILFECGVKAKQRKDIIKATTQKNVGFSELLYELLNRSDLPLQCEKLLLEMIEKKIYTPDCVELRQYLLNKAEICDAVDELLLTAGRITTAELVSKSTLYGLENRQQVPTTMRQTYKGAKVKGDGNCWYSSLSITLFGTPDYMPVIRFASVRAMLKYERYFTRHARDYYMPDINHPPLEERYRFLYGLLGAGTLSNKASLTERKYGDEIIFRRGNINFSWADNVSQLASQIAIDRPIATYSNQMEGTWTAHSRNLDDSKAVFVLHQTNHFDAMLPISQNIVFVKPVTPNLMYGLDVRGLYVDEYEG